MLPKYAIASSVLDIGSLDQLSRVCRRVDYAYIRNAPVVAAERGMKQRLPYRNNQSRPPRAVHSMEAIQQSPNDVWNFPGLNIEAEENIVDDPTPGNRAEQQSGEILELRRNQNNNLGDLPTQERRECFNCHRTGHSFSVCPSPRSGQFGFRCGSRDVTSFTCRKCAKNGGVDSAAIDPAPSPQNQ